MRRTACLIGVMAAAAMLAGCGKQTQSKTPDPSAVRPKEALTETQKMTESQVAEGSREEAELQAASSDLSAEPDMDSAGSPARREAGEALTAETLTTDGLITEDEAKAIALKDAGIDEAELSGVRVRLELDDGGYEYEVDFYVDNLEYDYDIDATTGKIVSMDRDIDDDFRITDQLSGEIISEDEAKKVALAKVPQAAEQDVRVHLDEDDGRQIYEGSIYLDGIEYEFEIDAVSGVLLEWEEDD